MLNISKPILEGMKMFIQYEHPPPQASTHVHTHKHTHTKNYLKSHIQTSMSTEHATHNIYKI